MEHDVGMVVVPKMSEGHDCASGPDRARDLSVEQRPVSQRVEPVRVQGGESLGDVVATVHDVVGPQTLEERSVAVAGISGDRQTGKFGKLDEVAEQQYVHITNTRCQSEKYKQRQAMEDAQGWFSVDMDAMNKARNMELPNCNKLKKLGLDVYGA